MEFINNIKSIIIISLLHVGVYCDPEDTGDAWPAEIILAFPLKGTNDAKH